MILFTNHAQLRNAMAAPTSTYHCRLQRNKDDPRIFTDLSSNDGQVISAQITNKENKKLLEPFSINLSRKREAVAQQGSIVEYNF